MSSITFPLKLVWPVVDTSRIMDECLQGIEFENLSTLTTSSHKLPPDVLLDSNSRFVDPYKYNKDTGLFSMSEIAFDRDRHYALVNYWFWCGSLCGNGATLVFEKVKGEWRKANRNCPRWIS